MRRKQQVAREYQGEVWGKRLVAYLNGNPRLGGRLFRPQIEDGAGQGRVRKLVTTFHEAFPLFEKYIDQLGSNGDADIPEAPEVEKFEKELSKQAAHYKRELKFVLDPNPRTIFYWGLPRARTLPELQESHAINDMVSLASQNLLQRVCKCECDTWFFARFSHQQFCSPRCRSRHQRQSPEFKALRRKYMRDYYQLQKKNVK